MMVSEKPPFDFTDEDDLEPDVVDDIICSMTNASAVYLKKQQELIIEEDLINDPAAKAEREEEKAEKRRKKEREEKEKKNKRIRRIRKGKKGKKRKKRKRRTTNAK